MKALVKLTPSASGWTLASVPEVGHNDVSSSKSRRPRSAARTSTSGSGTSGRRRPFPSPCTSATSTWAKSSKSARRCKRFKIGDRVSGEGHITCGFCRNCRAGRRHLCRNTVGVGVNRAGAFAEYLAIPAVNAFKMPDDISDDLAAIFDPFGNATHTALSFNLVGEDVLITGAGPDRHHGRGDRASRRRAPCRHHRRQRPPPGTCAARWARPAR
jgi:threonine 3-dehydrogenase